MIILWALAAANILGVGWLAWRMVSINQEVDEQTQTRTFDCRDCGGLGVLWAPESGEAIRNTCLTCGGRGTITLPALAGGHKPTPDPSEEVLADGHQPTPDPSEEGKPAAPGETERSGNY